MAYFRKNRKFVAKRYRKKPSVKKAVRKVKSRVFTKKVLNVIRSQNETKYAFTAIAPTAFNSGIAGQVDCYRVIPNISQGTADNARIGDQVRVQSLTIKGIVNMYNQNGTQGDGVRRLACRVMILTPKAYATWASAYANATTWMPYILKKGGTTTAFTGVMSDLYADVNTDAVTCHYNKVMYFNQSGYYAVGGATSGIVPSTQDNLVRFFSKTFSFKNKLFKYDSNIDTGLTPSNTAMVLVVGYVLLDGTDVPDTATNRMWIQADCKMKYEDS